MKKLLTIFFTLTMVLTINNNTFDLPSRHNLPSNVAYTGMFGGEESIFVQYPELKDFISKYGKNDTEESESLPAPEITEAVYHHKNIYFGDRLQVCWNDVDGATSYEIEVTKPDGTTHTYVSNNNLLIVKKGSDEFVTGCLKQNKKSAKVKIRAVKNAGEVYSAWTEERSISCDSVHVG